MKIKQSTALVTGANRGIGRALVKALLERGVSHVYATSRSGKLPDELANDPRVTAITLDITSKEQVTAAAQLAGDANLLINNAGTLSSGTLLDNDLDLARRDLDTNYFGTLNMLKAFAPNLERQDGDSAIANFLSLSSLAGSPGMGGYSASKAAALSMTQSVRPELASRGIALHAVFPGPVDTDMTSHIDGIPKAHPSEVAARVLDGIEAGKQDIFPDPISAELEPLWTYGGKQVETVFASFR